MCRIISTVNDHIDYITHTADSLDLSNHQHLPNVLLDLANYDHEDIFQHSLLLIDRYYTCQSDVFDRALQTQLLVTVGSCDVYNTMESLYLELIASLRSCSGDDPSPVKALTTCCWLKEEVEGYEPHQINQNIILGFGMALSN